MSSPFLYGFAVSDRSCWVRDVADVRDFIISLCRLCNRSFTWLIAYRMQQTKYIVFTLLLIPAVSFHPVYHDYCILGAGPGGLQAARFLKDSGRDYVVLERNQSPGSFFLRFPRHRKLISINKKFTGRKNREFNLRHDWNSLLSQDRNLLFGRYSSDFFPHADDMLRYLQNFSAGIHVHYGVNISRIQLKSSSVAWNGHFFFLLDQAGRAYQCRAINNGLLDTYQLKSLDGLLEGDLSDLALVRDEAGKVYVSHRHYLRRDTEPAGNKTGITLSTLPQDDLDNFAAREPYDRVIRCLGWSFDFSIFDRSVKLKPATKQNRKYPWLTASYEARYTRGLFVVGTASHAIDFRQSAGGFIHGFRYTARAAHRLMEKRYHHVPWPVTHHPTSQLLNVLLRRLNEASGLYQMFGVLADVVIIGEDSQHFQYLEEVPAGILPDFEQSTGREVHDTGLFVLTMEYGKNFSGPDKDVFYYDRAIGEARAAWQSNFLHPVVYYYRQLPTEQQMKLRPEHWPLPRPDRIHHVVEDFLTDWTGPNAHVLPLRRFLENCLQMDLRAFYAESCFLFALTHRKLPIFCQQGYLRDQGLTGTEQLRLLSIEAGLMEDYKSRSHVASFERPHQGSTRDEL
ncbi:FAD-dependent oxidoreductase domain-containing protein 2 isoform X3 [Bombina bombina]|uniref:FAD-dependent oxidoreductase domain-containing protein 2 isoform X3 n=1 Tax=Bombina bombina TaxID=8345 RepID=UPI00235B16DF|nr:FAD-dependent oxidoreductase domain-containing protein 2 isoform X3 [Bombina bombina]